MRLGIGFKLNFTLLALLTVSLGSVAFLTGRIFTEDLAGLLRKETLDSASSVAGRLRADLRSISERTQTISGVALQLPQATPGVYPLKFFGERLAVDPQNQALTLLQEDSTTGEYKRLLRVRQPEGSGALSDAQLDALDEKVRPNLKLIASGKVDFHLGELEGARFVRLGFPVVEDRPGHFSHLVIADLAYARFAALLAEGSSATTLLIDGSGKVVGTTDPENFRLDTDLSAVPVVQRVSSTASENGQLDFEREGQGWIAAFHKVGFGDLSVVALTPSESVLAAERDHFRRALLASGIFLFFALGTGLAFSRILTGPIRALASAADRVARGDLSARMKPRGKPARFPDELTDFSISFDRMVLGLQERDKAKDALFKYQGKEVGKRLLSGDIPADGDRRNAIILFTDLRDFTALSESMDPLQLVNVLNRYFGRMVGVVTRHKGTVSKFIGDSIMALWGVPDYTPEAADLAIRAALKMRRALAEFNQELANERIPPLRMGIGIHTGTVIAGNVGSSERMEYTVIGDAVNTASRIEGATKDFGTDLLVSHELLRKVSSKYVIEAVESRLRGKREVVALYKIHGYVDAKGKQILVPGSHPAPVQGPVSLVVPTAPAKPADVTDDITLEIERKHLAS